LTNIVKQWGVVTTSPPELAASPNRQDKISTNEIVYRGIANQGVGTQK
jgi:serine-type D-Ala-D-Ala carboxypeptidase/endopeptidase (penicillin-binding protein 4)